MIARATDGEGGDGIIYSATATVCQRFIQKTICDAALNATECLYEGRPCIQILFVFLALLTRSLISIGSRSSCHSLSSSVDSPALLKLSVHTKQLPVNAQPYGRLPRHAQRTELSQLRMHLLIAEPHEWHLLKPFYRLQQ
jgi:hypothetical protein